MYDETCDPTYFLDIKLSDLFCLKLQTLTISSIIHLTIDSFDAHDVSRLLKQFPQLKYLRINRVYVSNTFTNEINTDRYVILHEFNGYIKDFELFVKQILNFKKNFKSNSGKINIGTQNM